MPLNQNTAKVRAIWWQVLFFVFSFYCRYKSPCFCSMSLTEHSPIVKKNIRNTRFVYLCVKEWSWWSLQIQLPPQQMKCHRNAHCGCCVSPISTHPSALKSKLGREFTLKTWYMCESWGNFVLCSPSIFKLIIWKQAAVNFGHRHFD